MNAIQEPPRIELMSKQTQERNRWTDRCETESVMSKYKTEVCEHVRSLKMEEVNHTDLTAVITNLSVLKLRKSFDSQLPEVMKKG